VTPRPVRWLGALAAALLVLSASRPASCGDSGRVGSDLEVGGYFPETGDDGAAFGAATTRIHFNVGSVASVSLGLGLPITSKKKNGSTKSTPFNVQVPMTAYFVPLGWDSPGPFLFGGGRLQVLPLCPGSCWDTASSGSTRYAPGVVWEVGGGARITKNWQISASYMQGLMWPSAERGVPYNGFIVSLGVVSGAF
jgi:hypothetical protein